MKNKGLKWMDSSRRGYMLVELTPERTTSEWRFVETIKERTPRLGGLHRMTAKHGHTEAGFLIFLNGSFFVRCGGSAGTPKEPGGNAILNNV